MLRKQDLKLLGRENIPGALSKASPCNPGNLHFLRYVRFTHNTRLSCCTCHAFIVQVSSSTKALGLCFVIVPLFTKLYAFLLYGCSYLDFLLCNPIWSTSNRPSSKTQNNSNKTFKTQASNIIESTYTFRSTTKKCYYTNTFVILHATIWCKYISIHNEM